MSEKEFGSFQDLFADAPIVQEQETEQAQEEVKEEIIEDGQEEAQEETTEEAKEEVKEESDPVIAKIEMDGQEFELDQPKIQKIAEAYVELRQENAELQKQKEVVEQVVTIRDRISRNEDLKENFALLGLDYDQIILDGAKELIRRSAMSKAERDFEDMQKENAKLKKLTEEKERQEEEDRKRQEGAQQGQYIIDTVKKASESLPKEMRKEVISEVIMALERRIRAGGVIPSAKALEQAVQTVYKRKEKLVTQVTTQKKLPKITTNNPTPSTQTKKPVYNAVDYNKLF